MIKYYLVFISLLFQISISAQEDPNGYKTFYYPNGNKSAEGLFVNGKPEGIWKNYFETGVLKSVGKRTNSELDSIWVFYYESGLLKEEITYAHSKRNGLNHTYNEEGFKTATYEYLNDTLVHKSFHYYAELGRVQFERPYENGTLSGQGYEFGKDGRIVALITYDKGVIKSIQKINQYDSKRKKVGLWITYHTDVEEERVKLEEGRYKNGLRNGYFRLYDKNEVVISTLKYVNGQLVEDAEELMAVDLVREFHPDASVKWEKSYLGTLPHGRWKEYDTNGVIISTIVYNMGIKLGEGLIDEQGLKQGPWKEFYTSGELRGEGAYKDGARIGKWKFFYANGKQEQIGKYKEGGRPHGTWVWYYPDGELKREETYLNGREEGEHIEYSPTGEIIKKGYYSGGLEEGEFEINTGDYLEKGEYSEGMMQGVWIGIYKSTGKKAFEGEFIDDEPQGKHVYYYANGKKRLEGKYQLGIKIGDWKRYDENGVVVLTIRYTSDGKHERIDGKKVKFDE
jgi:antitoxin component YwqK of YwqJK toxin-antitoxin module